MSLPRYERYEHSGIDWLGEVQAHWKSMSLGKVTESKCDGPFGSGIKSEHYTDYGALVIRLQNIRAEGFAVGERAFIDADYFDRELRGHEVNAQDILVAGLGDDNNVVGRACVAPPNLGPALVKADCFRFRVDATKVNPKFLATQLTASARHDAGRLSSGSTRSRIPLGTMASRAICLPPLEEQQSVVTFLDHETTKIDGLIDEQKRLIELLKEKRQAVISRAVTKGLEPNVPMKDSGVEWLGEVPAQWDVRPLMRLTAVGRPIMYGIVLPGPDVPGGIPIVKGGDVRPHRLRLELLNRTTPEIEAPYARARLRPKDIVYSIRGSIGDAEQVPNELDCANITQDAARVSPAPEVYSKWLLYAMKSRPIFCQLELRSLGATIKGINIFDLKRARIPVPPGAEQKRIAAFVDEELGRLDDLVAQAELSMELLLERRAALISAAVTGKIDVRHFPTEAA